MGRRCLDEKVTSHNATLKQTALLNQSPHERVVVRGLAGQFRVPYVSLRSRVKSSLHEVAVCLFTAAIIALQRRLRSERPIRRARYVASVVPSLSSWFTITASTRETAAPENV